MPRLPKENLYTTRCPQCGCLVLLSGDELLQRWEATPEKNHGYKYLCPGCGNKTSYTTTELLIEHNDLTFYVPFDDYMYVKEKTLGHGIVLDEGTPAFSYALNKRRTHQ